MNVSNSEILALQKNKKIYIYYYYILQFLLLDQNTVKKQLYCDFFFTINYVVYFVDQQSCPKIRMGIVLILGQL